jgi:hypothetical protein
VAKHGEADILFSFWNPEFRNENEGGREEK